MFDFLAPIVLLLLAIPVVGIAGLLMSVGNRRRITDLDRDFRRIRGDVWSLADSVKTMQRNVAVQAPPEPPRPPAVSPEPPSASAAAATKRAPEPVASAEEPVEAELVERAIETAGESPEVDTSAEPASSASRAEEPSPVVGARAPSIPPVSRIKAPVQRNIEEEFGTRWAVWLGGAALALGGVFLVQYSIEQGWFGPAARIAFGGLLALVLLATGEWMRRSEARGPIAGVPAAHIPSILVAAGTVVAFATVYAAYALYGFIDTPAAFALLGAVALGTLGGSLLHGPWLAALGLVGSYLTPALLDAAKPDYTALSAYLTVVTAATFALSCARRWGWLAAASMVLGLLWVLPGIGVTEAFLPSLFQIVAGFALAVVFLVPGLVFAGRSDEAGTTEASLILVAHLFAALLVTLGAQHAPIGVAALALLAATTVVLAFRDKIPAWSVPAAALVILAIVADWAVDGVLSRALLGRRWRIFDWQSTDPLHLVTAAAGAAVFAAAGVLAQSRKQLRDATVWAATGIAAPIAFLVAAYWATSAFERSIPCAVAALVLAGVFGAAAERLTRNDLGQRLSMPVSLYSAGSVVSIALLLTFALDGGWLSVGLAAMVAGVAWVAALRPQAVLRWLAAGLVAVVLARIAWEPRIVGDALGATPVFNWLLYGYGVPAASFWLGGELLRRRSQDAPAAVVSAAAILLTVALVVLEVRHAMNGGLAGWDPPGLAELGAEVTACLVLAIGLEAVARRTGYEIHRVGAASVTAIALGVVVLGPALVLNPWWTGVDVGGPVFNLIALAVFLPGLLAAGLAGMTRTSRPQGYSTTLAGVAILLLLLSALLEVARIFRGPVLTAGVMSDGEQYAYSAVLIVFGTVLLLVGIAARSKIARLASLAVIGIAILKVFLVDMGDLTGVFRALSFIGLGLVLVGIGWLYQRLLFPRRQDKQEAAPVGGTSP